MHVTLFCTVYQGIPKIILNQLTYRYLFDQLCLHCLNSIIFQKHILLHEIFSIFGDLPDPAKQVRAFFLSLLMTTFHFVHQDIVILNFQVVQRHIPILVRSIGTSSDLLGIISAPPRGSENLVMKVC
jgi:hypothetical protein